MLLHGRVGPDMQHKTDPSPNRSALQCRRSSASRRNWSIPFRLSLLLVVGMGVLAARFGPGIMGDPAPGMSEEADTAYSLTSVDLVGVWTTGKWEMYHTLKFIRDSFAIVDNHIDSVMIFRGYHVEGDSLLVLDGFGDYEWRLSILSHTDSTLKVGGFPGITEPRIYRRKRKTFPESVSQ